MAMYYICKSCGAELFPEVITEKEATTLSNGVIWSSSQIYMTIKPCLCTAGNKNAIVHAIKDAIKQFER